MTGLARRGLAGWRVEKGIKFGLCSVVQGRKPSHIPYNCHIIRILHATPATEAAEYFHLGFQRCRRPFHAVVEHVLTATCRSQITGLTLPECGTVSVYLNTSQLPGQQPPAAPYSLIAYPVQGLPSAYPLSLTGSIAPWTVNYPAGEPRFAPQTPCNLRASTPLLTTPHRNPDRAQRC